MKRTQTSLAVQSFLSKFWTATKQRAMEAIILIIITLLAFLGGQIEWRNILPVRPQTVLLQEKPYHIGDAEYVEHENSSGGIIEIPFDHPAPQANPFQANFELRRIPKELVFTITARHVDPDESTSAVEIWVNGNFVTYLNRQFGQEVMDYQTVSIPINPAYLQKGKNILLLSVKPSEDGLDDVEFKDAKLEIR